MKYIAAREVFGGEYLYFQDNINDSPKWTGDIKKAKRFNNVEDTKEKSDLTGIYEIIVKEVEE